MIDTGNAKAGESASSQGASSLVKFARFRRIVKTDEFSSVFRLRPVLKSAHFMLYARPTDLPHARLGVVVAKKLAARAVTRNLVKRVTREVFRHASLQNLDCVVRLSQPINRKHDPAANAQIKRALRAELMQLFAKPQVARR